MDKKSCNGVAPQRQDWEPAAANHTMSITDCPRDVAWEMVKPKPRGDPIYFCDVCKRALEGRPVFEFKPV